MKRFLCNIGHSFSLWKSHTAEMIFKSLQIFVSLLLIGFMVHQYTSYQALYQQIQHLMQQKDVYVLWDCNDNEWSGHIERSNYTKSWNHLLDTIINSNLKRLVVDNEQPVDISDREAEVIRTNENFFQFFEISISEKETNWETYFKTYFESEEEWKKKTKPAIVGAAYRKDYKLGDCITSDSGERFLIKGFLKKNQSYALPTQSKEMVSLNRALIIPVNIDKNEVYSIQAYIKYCLYITKGRETLSDIEQVNREEKLNDGYFCSYRKQLVNVKRDTIEGILQYGTFGVILFVFSIIGFLGMLIQLMMECEKEYAVHLLCGAQIKDILLRLLFQIGLLLLCGDILCFIVFYNGQVRLAVSLLSLISFLLFFLYSTLRLHSESIMQKLRRNE